MEQLSLSVIVPVFNGSATIGRCLAAAFASRYERYEVIVVDDCSSDGSVEIVRAFPCTLIRLDTHAGAGAARNAGARAATGEILFFIDADCLLPETTLAAVNAAVQRHGDAVIGGTYTPLPADTDFASVFQSVFIHYSETRLEEPDYIASHAMAVRAGAFQSSGGFPERFLPIMEDVEFSHRLRRSGRRLVMDPGILVRHIFNFTLRRSLGNAFKKSRYWTVYSLHNRDVFADSGTASIGMKINVLSCLFSAAAVLHGLVAGAGPLLAAVPLAGGAALLANRGLAKAYLDAKGWPFALRAMLYYQFVYPLAAAAGITAGVMQFLRSPRLPGPAGAEP